MAFDDWLDKATAADLDALAQCLLDGRIPSTGSVGSIQLAGFGFGAVELLRRFDGTKPDVIAWTLQRLARERRAADDRYASAARLVWSGASDDDEAIRDTSVVLDDLFRRARRHVLISTFVIYEGVSVFRGLVEQARRVPGLRAWTLARRDPPLLAKRDPRRSSAVTTWGCRSGTAGASVWSA